MAGREIAIQSQRLETAVNELRSSEEVEEFFLSSLGFTSKNSVEDNINQTQLTDVNVISATTPLF